MARLSAGLTFGQKLNRGATENDPSHHIEARANQFRLRLDGQDLVESLENLTQLTFSALFKDLPNMRSGGAV